MDVRRRRMRVRGLLLTFLTMFAWPAHGFQCAPEHPIESAYQDAERVFLIYVLETRLEEHPPAWIVEEDVDLGDESVKLISADYRVVEEFKGDSGYKPRLLDLLGIGTGYVGLTPGVYFAVFLPRVESGEDPDLRYVNICTVPLSHYRLQVEDFQNELDVIRRLAKEGQ